jgi:hypothetical protein
MKLIRLAVKRLTAPVVSRWLRAAGHRPWNPRRDQSGFIVSALAGAVQVFYAPAPDEEPASPEERPVALARYGATLLGHGCESTLTMYPDHSGSLTVRRGGR